jgi:hypothetical protein
MDANETVVIPETPPTVEELQELRNEIMEAAFMKLLVLGQATGELAEDPTREETIAFVTNHAAQIWDDYQVYKAEQTASITEATLVEEEPKDASSN